jgi:hypothetical protein
VYGWPGWWSKLELFRAEHDDLGPLLYLDLDTVIVGPLGPLVSALPADRPTLLSDFYRPERAQSGLMHWPVASREATREAWGSKAVLMPRAGEMQRSFRGDGEALDAVWRAGCARWQDVAPGAVVSYKVHVRQVRGEPIPLGAAVVCHHGHPRPWQARRWATYFTEYTA